MYTSWFIELKFNSIERLFHQFRIQNNLLALPPSMNAKIGPQHVALVDDFIINFEKTIYEEFNPLEAEDSERAYLDKMKNYFRDKCAFLNKLIDSYASNLTDNEVQIYFYRKMIRLIDDLNSERLAIKAQSKKVFADH